MTKARRWNAGPVVERNCEGVNRSMSMNEAKLAFEEADIANVISRAKAMMAAEDLTLRQLAGRVGIAEGTLGPFLNAKYQGRPERIAEALNRWMTETADRAVAAREAVAAPGFQRTRTAEDVLRALDYGQLNGKMVFVALRPGCGKTTACEQQTTLRNRAFLATITPASSGIAGCLIAILDAMGEPEAKGTPAALSARVAAKVRTPGALIIIDEAQHLKIQAVEELRAIHDATKCGLAFVGDERMHQIFDANSYAQLRRRIGRRVATVGSLDKDAETIAIAWGVTDPMLIKFLCRVAAKPNGLGGITNVMQLATQLARTEATEIALPHLKAAWTELMPELPL